jgi:hypothetical protein
MGAPTWPPSPQRSARPGVAVARLERSVSMSPKVTIYTNVG